MIDACMGDVKHKLDCAENNSEKGETMSIWSEYKKKVDWKKFVEYRVKLRVKDLVGGLPKDPDLDHSQALHPYTCQ